ncbi:MAG: sulfotransferase [Acidiferrobacterales bacterium]|nr:sulfotransferase [Acidiferrobacterales bacterium]
MKNNQSVQKIEKLFIESATKLQNGDPAGARRGLEKVAKLAPKSAAVWYNLALAGQHLGLHHKAVKEYQKSLKINPSQIDAMVNLGLSHKALEQVDEARRLAEKALNMQKGHPRALNLLGSLLAESRQYTEAIPLLEEALANDQENTDARQNLANSFLESGDSQKAEEVILPLVDEEASAKVPTELYVQTLLDQKRYIEVPPILKKLKSRYQGDEDVLILEMSFCELINDNFSVVDIAEKILNKSPRHARVWNSLGSAYFQLDSIANAKNSYQKAMDFDAEHPEYSNNLGLAFASLGEKDKAEHYYRNALSLSSDYVEAYRNLVAMKKFTSLEDPDAVKINHLWENDELPDQTKCKVAFALGKIYDDCGLYDQAFASYDEGNRLKSLEIDMDFDQYFGHIDRIIDVFDRKPAQSVAVNQNLGQPIFILGMSRSGTTLVEQIISRHPGVTGCGELSCIERAIGNLEKNPDGMKIYPDDFIGLSEEVLAKETKGYGDWVSRLHDIQTPFFTDKMPFNFVHIWLIKALFPKSSIVHCHRHPLDVIVSNYFQLFGSDINFVYNLEVLTGYYLRYHKLMRHWHQLFAGEIYKVQYEALVADSENQTRLLVEGAGLQWDEACLDPNRSDTAVRTASIWQVREGIYTSSKERWRRYEKHLGAVIETLQSHHVLDEECRYLD